MKITRLQKAKDYRIFRDFSWPTTGLPDFARFNVIYGWNGAGKTSFSNIFRHMQRKEALTEGQIEVVVDQTRVSGASFNTAAIPAVRTFNRDTVHRNVFEVPNQQLAAYLGRDELRFEVEQNGYRITRGGHPATHLSDGERTAIAFLYFLKSLQGTDFDLKTGVVVIDDPVSSLDANSLFSAFGFMKHQTSEVGQLFVLTHNFTFFRQVRNWFYNLPGQQKKDISKHPARFYMLATEFVHGVRTANLDVLDPFLHQYESEYHYLFKRVYEEAHKPANQGLEAYYAIPNIARRLLEAFLAFRVPEKSGELYQKLEVVTFDPAKKTRILRFLHTYSHFDQVADAGHDPSVLSETPAILQEVLALIQACDSAHFASMTALVSPPVAAQAMSSEGATQLADAATP